MTALWHPVYDSERLREAYHGWNRDAAPGIAGQTWAASGEHLEENRRDLSDRLKRGAYHAPPVERVDIPKPDGHQRPIGKPTLAEKMVQRATVEGLNAIDAEDVRGFSSGFRPGRRPPEAVEAVTVGIDKRQVNWGLEADLRGFFEAPDHEGLVQFVEQRIGDRRVGRHLRQWLKAGVLEEGPRHRQEEGTPQGGRVSPLAANISRHDVLDLWVERWRQRNARGAVILGRDGDDCRVGVEPRDDAERFWTALRERFQPFNRARHPEQTRLIEVGRLAAERRQRRGQGKPETFNRLGLTHICRKTRKGKLTVRRKTSAKRLRKTRQDVKDTLRLRLPWPISPQGAWLRSGRLGHDRSYGGPRNGSLLRLFRETVRRSWCRTLRRRSQRQRLTWPRR